MPRPHLHVEPSRASYVRQFSRNGVGQYVAASWQLRGVCGLSGCYGVYVVTIRGVSDYTLLKSDVTTRDHVVRCRGSQECSSRNVHFACKFHRRSHRVRITLKSTTMFHFISFHFHLLISATFSNLQFQQKIQ